MKHYYLALMSVISIIPCMKLVTGANLGTLVVTDADKNNDCRDRPGAVYFNGCDWCRCSGDLKASKPNCIKPSCPEKVFTWFSNTKLFNKTLESIPSAPDCNGFPGITWTDGCNSCHCPFDLNIPPACTQKGCQLNKRQSWKPIEV